MKTYYVGKSDMLSVHVPLESSEDSKHMGRQGQSIHPVTVTQLADASSFFTVTSESWGLSAVC